MSYQNLLVSRENNIETITVNRPEKLNALNRATINELSQALNAANSDNDVQVVILTGAGTKAFVAGADIAEFSSYSSNEGEELSRNGHQSLFDLAENLSKPIIAAVNGFALGGGLELAMSCHIRVASDNARMGLPEVSLGVIPGYGGTQRLPRLVGRGKANEMIFTAGMMKAEEALNYGLVNYVVPQEDLISTCVKLAQKITKNSPMAIAKTIKTINASYQEGLNGFDVEINEFGKCFSTDDFKEGTTAFLEKRKPAFTGK
jgi:enoyl-CoA hydratase